MQYFILQSQIVHLSWFTDKINHTKFFMSPTIHTTLSTTLLATIAIIQYQDSFIFWLHDKRCSKTLQHGPSQTTINYLLKESYSMRLEIWDLKMGVGVGGGMGGQKNPFCGEIWTLSGTIVHNVGSSGLHASKISHPWHTLGANVPGHYSHKLCNV